MKRILLPILVIGILLLSACGEQVINAVDSDKLLDIAYNQPDKIVTVEGDRHEFRIRGLTCERRIG